MRVVAFQHVPFEDTGNIRPVLESRGISIETVDLYADPSLPELSSAAGLIFMGGPMSVNDDLPWIDPELEVIAAAVRRGQPVFGVCLGAQLLAKALGATVRRNPVKEIGWSDVHLTDAASADPVFGGLEPRQTVLQWHGETFDLPAGAVHIASSPVCQNQAFRAASRSYGIQFHPEVTPEMIDDWVRQDANCGDVRELDGPIDAHLHTETLDRLCRHLFGNWAALLG
jgi:GMP synthase-like glutamine amidotransferase